MKLFAKQRVTFPKLKKSFEGEFECTEEEAKIYLASPFIIKVKKNGSFTKTRGARNRR